MPDREWWSALWPSPGDMLRALGIRPEMTVIDLCCGDGYFTTPLAQLVGGKVYAVDLDPVMIEQAQTEVARQGATVRRWMCGDARKIATFIGEKADFVLMANTFHGVPEPRQLAGAVRSVLTPQGLFCVVNWHAQPREQTIVLGEARGPQSDMRMSPMASRVVVEKAGFHLVQLLELPPYHYGAVFQVPP
jgi:ubiquinone/menaquinone biosynthesis C-methylase UbiE